MYPRVAFDRISRAPSVIGSLFDASDKKQVINR